MESAWKETRRRLRRRIRAVRVGPWEAPREESHADAGGWIGLLVELEESVECRGEVEPDM